MITEELENKLKISRNTCIYCPTLELAKQVLNIFDQLKLKWCSERNYTIYTNWNIYKENTVYYPFDGEFSPLKYAQSIGYKIISAEKFIVSHAEEFDLKNYEPKGELEGFPKEIIKRILECQEEQGNKRNITVFEENKFSLLEEGGFDWDKTKENIEFWGEVIIKENFNLFFKKYPKQDNQDNSQEFNLENYEPKGELEGFPKEIITHMLKCQEEQGNPRDVSVFEKQFDADQDDKGFTWNETKEKFDFWEQVIHVKNFNHFFEKYPKKEEYQEFRVGDKVIDILFDLKGKITNVKSNGNLEIQFEGESCPIEFMKIAKRTPLLHYRDDYNYDVIDFNNLPKREPNRWRANKGSCYWVIENFSVYEFKENNTDIDDTYNNLGNYFKTKKEAQEVADKLKKYFQELIKSK